MSLTMQERRQLRKLLKPYLEHDSVRSMRGNIQHGRITTYQHALAVVSLCYLFYLRHPDLFDEKVLTSGAFLHDFYLYDWHEGCPTERKHGFTHPETACKNAVDYFDIDERTQEMILTHMWPLTITKLPRSREAWLLCIADKVCSARETLFFRKKGNDL